jgi:hypothetical protein
MKSTGSNRPPSRWWMHQASASSAYRKRNLAALPDGILKKNGFVIQTGIAESSRPDGHLGRGSLHC